MTPTGRDAHPLSDRGAPVGPVDSQIVPRFAGFRTFARLPMLDALETADVAVLGAPYDGSTTFRPGARYGPQAIREASLLLRPYNEPLDVMPFEIAQVADAGDAPAGGALEQAHDAIFASAQALHARGISVFGLGGDHSVSLPLLRAAAARFGQLSLLQVDAHPDTWDSYFGAKVGHGTMFRRAVEEQLIEPNTSLQIGLRGPLYDRDDYPENRRLGFTAVLAREFAEIGIAGTLEIAARTLKPPIYLTFDIDGIDPAFAPGTGAPEAAGLTSREALGLLRAIAGQHEIVSADLVEIAPAYDPTGVTATTAAAVAFELVTMLAMASARR
jgi:agmatinase